MINLLSPQEKKILLLDEKKRLVIILGSLILIFLVCLILILFAIEINLQGQVNSQKIILSLTEKQFQELEIQNLRKDINLINQTFSKLNSFYQNQIYFNEILEKISVTLPEQVYLTNLSINLQSNEKQGQWMNINLSGFCKNRDILFEFKENLEKKEDFKEIYFPPLNWVKPSDIDFNVTFKVIIPNN